MRRFLVGMACAGLLALWVPVARAAAPNPDLIFSVGIQLIDPCGLAVDSGGGVYVSNYHAHRVDLVEFNPTKPKLEPKLANVDPLDGPCGIDFDSSGRLYVNNYHRAVDRYSMGGGLFEIPTPIDASHPTGVAVDPATDDVYVNARTHIAAYGPSGAPILDEGAPLQIGQGSLGDGYGLAVSGYPATAGRIYVPDHATTTVKVYDPAIDVDTPVQVMSGPPGGFGSLRDAAIAVDDATGEVYVADTLAFPQLRERPEAVIYVFDHTGALEGRLKYSVVDGSPVGLAVDNTGGPSQSRVYVTSGNTVDAMIYAYPPGSATDQAVPVNLPSVPASASGSPSAAAVRGGGEPGPQNASPSVISQKGKLRVAVSGKVSPKRLPREGRAAVSVSLGGRVSTADGSSPPKLRSMRIELNRGGRIDTRGLPTCEPERIQPGSSSRALSACRDSLVGTGSFGAEITLANQEPYPTQGRLLLFNALSNGKPVLLGHIHSRRPFATSFLITFEIKALRGGSYGTALDATLPAALRRWGNLTSLEMTLGRRYSHGGKRHSYLSAGCPAPKGFPGAIFPLARTTFAFEGGMKLSSVLSGNCKAKG